MKVMKLIFPCRSRTLFLAVFLLQIAVQKVYGSSAAGTETLIGVVGEDYVMLGADSSVSQNIVLTSSDIDKIEVIVDPFPEEEKMGKSREQQTIVVAAAGEFADADHLISILRANAALREYEASIGCDVDIIDMKGDGGLYPAMTPGLSVSAVAKLARGQIAQRLRSGSPFRLGVLIAGMQNEEHNPISQSKDNQSGSPLAFISEDVQRQLQQLSPTPKAALSHTEEDTPSLNDSTRAPKSTLRPHLYWLDEYGSLQKLKYASHGLGSSFLLAILDQGYKENLSREQAAALIQDCFNQLQTRYLINSPKPPIIKCIDANGCQRIGV